MSGQAATLLDVLKKKMNQSREELEAKQDESDELKAQLTEETRRREEVGIYVFQCRYYFPSVTEPKTCSIHLSYNNYTDINIVIKILNIIFIYHVLTSVLFR